jgi:hypothetical protein
MEPRLPPAVLGLLALGAGCTPEEVLFPIEGDYVAAYMADHFEDGGTTHTYVTVDTAQQIAIGPAHWDDPDPHGTTTMTVDPDTIQALTDALSAVDVPALDGVDLWAGDDEADRFYLDLELEGGEHYHVEWDALSDVPAELWDVQALLHQIAEWFLG